MPKLKHNYKANDSQLFSIPYGKAEDASKKKHRIKIQNVGNSTQNGKESPRNATTDPINNENVLKCYAVHQKASVVSLTKQFKEFEQKIQNTNLSIAEKNKENYQLKKFLDDLNKERVELSAQYNKLLKNNNKLEQQLTENNKRYSSLESGYDEKLSHFKTICRRTEIELTVQHKQNDNLLGELKTVQEQHRDLLAQFETMAQQKDNELIDLQMKYKQLQEQLIEMETTLEQQKLQFIMEKEVRNA
ncbi:uncharacterized protein LOC122322832 [Drosophila grimshawi]|uniref:uncharacterized protein LOC122322832 n=1 Tax=Drosophila grimshawi TaxID=7222 RepID=UPI001C935E9E|nr:uncharacterized protein LOC122322832 [Drosophila grimshawi]